MKRDADGQLGETSSKALAGGHTPDPLLDEQRHALPASPAAVILLAGRAMMQPEAAAGETGRGRRADPSSSSARRVAGLAGGMTAVASQHRWTGPGVDVVTRLRRIPSGRCGLPASTMRPMQRSWTISVVLSSGRVYWTKGIMKGRQPLSLQSTNLPQQVKLSSHSDGVNRLSP